MGLTEKPDDVPRFTGHSPKRTFACVVRSALHQAGIDTRTSKLPVEILRRINIAGGWTPKSKEFWDYSGDWQSFVGRPHFIADQIITFIASGRVKKSRAVKAVKK